jgi:hypothetical protein
MSHTGDNKAEDSADQQAEAARPFSDQVHREAPEIHREDPLHELREEHPRGDEDPCSTIHRSR